MLVEFLFYVVIAGCLVAVLAYIGDKYEKEPIFLIFLAIWLGMTSVILVHLVQNIIPLPVYGENPSLNRILLVNFFSAGFIEELAKFSMIYFFVFKWKDFNEYYDGLLYAGLVGLGFAVSENLMYMVRPYLEIVDKGFLVEERVVRQMGVLTLLKSRMLHAHFFIDFTAGIFVAKAKFMGPKNGGQVWKKIIYLASALILAVFLHGVFNTLALAENKWIFYAYFSVLVLGCVFLAFKTSRKSVFRKEILDSLPDLDRNRLMEVLRFRKTDKITVGFVAMMIFLTVVYLFFSYFVMNLVSALFFKPS
jgi:RsiW-degrading membrane proteinase PrsW (M82 family)